MSYSRKYYNRHLVQYREWENAIGKNIVAILNPSSILDLGCGVGSYLEGALSAGCQDLLGIEMSFDVAKEFFVPEISNHLKYGDITQDLKLNRTFDCVISFEVGEHINPEGTNGFIKNLTNLNNHHIIMTAAPPGQRGTGHINCREKQLWIDDIENCGFKYDNDLVNYFKNKWLEFNPEKYILNNLMVFKKL